MSLEIYRNNDISILQTGIDNLKHQLDAWFQGSDSEDPERLTLYASYIHTGQQEWLSQGNEAGQSLLRDLTGGETLLDSNDFEDEQILYEKMTGLERLNPQDQTTQEEWEAHLQSSGFLPGDYEYESLSELFETTDSQRLSLKRAINDLLMETQQEYLNNISSKTGFSILIYRKKTRSGTCRMRRILSCWRKRICLSKYSHPWRTEPGRTQPWSDYISFLREKGYQTEPGALNSLKALQTLLMEVREGALSQEELIPLLPGYSGTAEWLSVLTGDLPSETLEASILELYLKDSTDAVLKARAELFASRCFRSTAQIQGYYRTVREERFSARLEKLETPEELRLFYTEHLADPLIPPYLQSLVEKYLSARFSDRWESLLAGRDSTEETFGECEDLLVTLESSMTPRDKLDLLKEAGYTEKVDMVLKYTILENWRAFRESGFDGELTEEENWSVFWSLNDTSGTDYGDICDFEQTIGDLPEDLPYSTYSGLTLLQFAETLYGDSPFPVLIRMLQKQLGTATLFDTALRYFSQQISAEYQRAQADREYFDFLERIKETRRERNSDSYEELFMFERITEAEELILGENALNPGRFL